MLGWYPVDWWKEDQDILAKRYPGCTVETREKVLEYTLAPRKAGRTFKANESKVVADSGIVRPACWVPRSPRLFQATYLSIEANLLGPKEGYSIEITLCNQTTSLLQSTC